MPAEHRTSTSRPGLPETSVAADAHNCFFEYGELEEAAKNEEISGHRIDCGALGVDDDDDDFNDILNVSAQDKVTEKSSEMPEIQCVVARQRTGS